VLCADDHFTYERAAHGSQKVNQILKMIEEELGLEHQYIEHAQTIVVKIDNRTMENPVLKDW
jgi:hypothetical protein